MSQLYCSPEHFEYAKDGTCYSKNDLVTIATAYNKTADEAHQKVPLSGSKINIHRQLKDKLKKICGDKEYCWIDLKFIDIDKKRELEDAFRPKKPLEWYKNNRTWLNTYDIIYVMEQYEEEYKDFVFLGVYPIDFAATNSSGTCIGDFMCSFHIRQLLSKKKKRFGMVINTDPHNKGGQHWFAIYCSLDPNGKNFGIYHYDSTAYQDDSPEITTFMKKIQNQVSEVFKPKTAKKFEVKYNTVRKQFKNTECGMFSIVFLSQCLKNDTKFEEICQRMRQDDDINDIRNIIYRPHTR
jgi:hypothetical protein